MLRKLWRASYGVLIAVMALVLLALPLRAVWVNHDSDGDGLSDCRERAGLRTEGGAATYVTDPAAADSDGDLVPDSDEVGERMATSPLGELRLLWDCEHQTYRSLADPARPDSDFDGLTDAVELSGGSDVFSQDSDGDGLLDAAEWKWGSDPNATDSDGDGFPDVEDVHNEQSPVVADHLESPDAWLDEYTEGLYYGDARESDTVAQLVGSLSGGASSIIPVAGWFTGSLADARDVVANAVHRRWADAGISGAGLLPYVGDAAKAVRKTSQFVAKHPQLVGELARRLATWDKIPDGMRMRLLGATDPDSYDAAVKAKLSDKNLVALIARGADLAGTVQLINKAAGLAVGPPRSDSVQDEDGFFLTIDDATADLTALTAQNDDTARSGPVFVPSPSGTGGRLYDVCTACAHGPVQGRSTLLVAKIGSQIWSSTVQGQIDADHLIAGRGFKVEWHFYPGPTGMAIAPDITDSLTRAGIPFVVHMPS
ncbi:hypothetical protein NOZE110980_10165 [Nocardioides zeicaulis]